jgi:hypothetical protein
MRPSRYPVRRQWLPTLMSPVRWLVRLHPLQSWLVVMAVIVGLSLLRLRWLALAVAIGWTAYAIYTWVRPSRRRRWR